MPATSFFKPQGIPLRDLEVVELSVDELEAVRLADQLGLYQEQGAEQMQVSRQTFGRILASAHRKVADFLVNGKLLRIQGGNVELRKTHGYKCCSCKHEWGKKQAKDGQHCCPKCSSRKMIQNTQPITKKVSE
jgi:predicted DNA-binding protein (UPF0251 family)